MKRSLFKKFGRLGGQKRARRLTPERRSAIAARAARARWKSSDFLPPLMKSVRLDVLNLEDPTFLEELLSEGSLEDWRQIYQEISDHPFGPVAKALERVLSATRYYGITPLWKGILTNVQGSSL